MSMAPVCFLNKNLIEIGLFLRKAKSFVKFRIAPDLTIALTVSEIDNLLELYRTELTKEIARDDFRELIELPVVVLGGDTQRKFKI
ncbi:hypothetical protein J437_LFUL018935 [Ladona fulva]|uniref:Uncharacterized protein n=1 Tax=Ladona fulva TaxID=123851 RepID=A0A8K0KTG8_LADFU|nr:hypothetical protein J437_LFUL018935 [Ladona fulva]